MSKELILLWHLLSASSSRLFAVILVSLLASASVFAQAPETMSYQAIVRDASNNLVANHAVGMQISILKGSTSGNAVYVETQTPESNANGTISIEIGGGTPVTGTFATIDWADGPYFIKTEADPTGGTSYTITGTNQLLSVPYALHAKTAESITGAITETDPVFTASAANGISSTHVTNWNTAYGWGDHAIAGYLTTETDPMFSSNFSITSPTNDQLLKYNSISSKWENYTPSGSGLEIDPVFVASAANSITSTNITNWSTAYSWGDHAAAGYLTSYTETDPIFGASTANGITSGNITNWNTAYGWGNHATAGYLTSYTETDPVWVTASANYYTKTNMQTNGGAQLHFNNITSKPTTLSGYGITDAMSTSHAANVITSTNISNWNTAYGWGNHATAGYLTTEVDGSVTNEIELPTQTGNSGKYLTTNGTSPSWATIDKSTVGLGNVENTALSTWAGTANITTLGTIATGTWQGTAINASYIDVLPTSKITSGTFDNARVNWAAPGTIGSTTASSGAFTSLSASNGLSVSNGTVSIKPSGSGGTSGQVLTTDGSGAATWQTPTAASRSVKIVTSNTTLTATDELVIVRGAFTVTLPPSPTNGQVLMICGYNAAGGITTNGAVLRIGCSDYSGTYTFTDLGNFATLVYDSSSNAWCSNL